MDFQFLLEALEIILPFVAGGGLTWFFNYRLNKKKLENKIYTEEYHGVMSIIDDYISRVHNMSEQISRLTVTNLELNEQIDEQLSIHNKLKNDVRSIVRRCDCEDAPKLKAIIERL